MKLFIVGGNSPTAADLIEILRMQKIPYKAPPDKFFNPDEGVAIEKMITDYGPTSLLIWQTLFPAIIVLSKEQNPRKSVAIKLTQACLLLWPKLQTT
ncbi:MAG: hypothetical protein Ct9H90mP25_4060 [Gammaproteobacteria bacterium]|nr:MAG: hypothetical protein Ct9H90mP25_4060 [Gammaproteobacteria bacterium]